MPNGYDCQCTDFCTKEIKNQVDKFLVFVKSKKMELLPWQEDVARMIFTKPCASGKSVLIALLFAHEFEKAEREYYSADKYLRGVL